MIKKLNLITMLLLVALILSGCNSKPRVIQSKTISKQEHHADRNPGVLLEPPSVEHEVVVEEVMNTEKYSYLNVQENGEKFWIAISKRPVVVGQTYFYRDGLLKKNFYSKEFDRVFDQVFLVSRIWERTDPSAPQTSGAVTGTGLHGASLPDLEVGTIQHAAGAIPLAKLFSDRSTYEGKTVKITGRCVKLNPNIMNRNWLHIQDGSGRDLDLTVTTSEVVTLGQVVTLEGKIALNKDFGAGYRYDLIMEKAILK